MISTKLYIVFGLSVIFASILSAVGIEDSLTVYESQDTIVVVGDRYTLPLKNMTYTHQVISRQLVNTYGTHSALELVDMAFPSAFTLDKKVLGYGVGPDGGGSVNIRGQGGRPNAGLLVLINGHPDIMGLFGHPLPDVYGIDEMEQVEIIAGPASTVFGSNAMGGVINMKTRPDYDKWLRFSAEGGSFNTYNFGLSLNTMINDWGFFLSTRHNKTDGHIIKTGFESYRIQGGMEYKFDNIWHLFVEARYVPYSFDDPSREDNDPAGIGTYGKIKRATGEIILENKTEELSGSTQLYGNWGHHRFYDGFDGRDYTYGLSSYQQWHTNEVLSFSAGFDLIKYGGKAKNELSSPGIVNGEAQNLRSAGIYILGFYQGLKRFNFNFGVRYQYISLPERNISPVLGITYSVLPQFQLYTNFQNGFRYPTLNELYLFPPRNPDLAAENLNSVEVGFRYYWLSQNFIRISYYYNDVENIIQLIPPTPPPPRYVNSGEAIQRGVETQLHMYLTKNLALQFNYSYLDPDQITAYNPKHQFKYTLLYQWNKFQVSAYGRYVNALYAANNSQERLPDYHVLNMRIGLTLNQWDIYLKLRNILDRLYYVEPNYPAPGFFMLAGIHLGL
jgi:iron complex outermembrane receptor protein